MAGSTTVALRLAAVGLLVALSGCSEDRRDITEPDEPAAAFAAILSDPVEGSSLASAGLLGAAQASSSPAAGDVVYVSLPPETVLEGVRIVIRNLETDFARTEPLVDGGLDPVSVPAAVGDRLELVAMLSGGATLVSVVKVPARRSPRVVRTIPPRGKTDVPLNARVSVVFSEPIDPASVGPTSLRLMRGSAEVSGRIEVRDAQGLSLDFVPDRRLAAATDHQLVVSEAIRDRDGEALGAPLAVEFTTEPSACPNYVDPSNCPPFPTMGSGVVSGVVTVRSGDGVQPLPNVDVWGFINMTDGRGFSMAPVKTGADGAYRRTDVPDGFLVLYAAPTGYDQPCAATVDVRWDAPATSNIELVSQLDPRPGSATASPSISGTVYETTPEGRRPVAGARVYFEYFPDLVTATTTTNEAGRYSLCRLPSVQHGAVTAVKAGYATNGIVVVIANDDQVLDIELKR